MTATPTRGVPIDLPAPMLPADRRIVSLWVIYRFAEDETFALRHWTCRANLMMGDGGSIPTDTLDQARQLIPAGRANHGRQEDDHPSIVETWL